MPPDSLPFFCFSHLQSAAQVDHTNQQIGPRWGVAANERYRFPHFKKSDGHTIPNLENVFPDSEGVEIVRTNVAQLGKYVAFPLARYRLYERSHGVATDTCVRTSLFWTDSSRLRPITGRLKEGGVFRVWKGLSVRFRAESHGQSLPQKEDIFPFL